jgi:DNA replication protein DnaC
MMPRPVSLASSLAISRSTISRLIDRERRVTERRIREARFPAVKSLDTFEFTAIASLNKMLVLELARCEFITRRENVIALGNSGTGKTHVALALGLEACRRGFSTLFITAHGLAHQLMEARDEKRLLKFQNQLQTVKLLIVDELGYVPLSQVGAELLFEVFSQRYERGSTIVTSNLPFEEWPSVFRNERLTGALLDRLTHHVHILEMNGESYRLRQSVGGRKKSAAVTATTASMDQDPAAPEADNAGNPTQPDAPAKPLAALRRYGEARSASGFAPVAPGPKVRRPGGRKLRRR